MGTSFIKDSTAHIINRICILGLGFALFLVMLDGCPHSIAGFPLYIRNEMVLSIQKVK
jgi:hypothetical protein